MKYTNELNLKFGETKTIILLEPYSILTIDKIICNNISNIVDVIINGIKIQIDYIKDDNIIQTNNILFAMLIDGSVKYELPILETYINIPELNIGKSKDAKLYYDKMKLTLNSNYNGIELPNFNVNIYYRDIALNVA